MEMQRRLTICKLGIVGTTPAVYILGMQIEFSCQMVSHTTTKPDFIVENEYYITWWVAIKEF
jgi:hypothetical protein